MDDQSTTPAGETSAPTNKPSYKLNLGNVSVAVFEEQKQSKEGDSFTSHSIALRKSWKNQDGEFDDRTIYLDRRDVMKVVTALQQAYLATYSEADK